MRYPFERRHSGSGVAVSCFQRAGTKSMACLHCVCSVVTHSYGSSSPLVHSAGFLVGNHGGEYEYVDVSNWSKLFSGASFLISSFAFCLLYSYAAMSPLKSGVVVGSDEAHSCHVSKITRGHPKLYSYLCPTVDSA